MTHYDDGNSTINSEFGFSIKETRCEACNDGSNGPLGFIILGCGHTYHTRCLVENHHKSVYLSDSLNEDYFNTLVCHVCNTVIELDDVCYMHSKYIKNSSSILKEYSIMVEKIEEKMKVLKDEIRTCYDYKHKIHQAQEKSKQIMSIASTMT